MGAAASNPWCHTCFRDEEDGETGYMNLGDGRKLCSDCSSIAVLTPEEYKFIIQNVCEFFSSHLKLQVNENIPILFIDNHRMSKLYKGASGLYLPSISAWIPELSAYSLPVKIWYILTRWIPSRLPYCAIQPKERFLKGEGYFKDAVELLLGETIVVLFGVPEPWKWERSVEEGICQVVYYKWLQWFSSIDSNSLHKTNEQLQYTRKLKALLAHAVEWNHDEIYGQGFRNAMYAVETLGFKFTLDHTIREGTLPEVPPVVMRKKTTATTEITRKNSKITATPITQLLWKATSSTTKSICKAAAATVTNLLLKVDTAACETPRCVAMDGQRYQHYHQGTGPSSQNKLYNLNHLMSASPKILVFVGILFEHK